MKLNEAANVGKNLLKQDDSQDLTYSELQQLYQMDKDGKLFDMIGMAFCAGYARGYMKAAKEKVTSNG